MLNQPFDSIQQLALRKLSYKDYTKSHLAQELLKTPLAQSQKLTLDSINNSLDLLVKKGWLDNGERIGENILRKYGKIYNLPRLKLEMKKKHLSNEIIDQLLTTYLQENEGKSVDYTELKNKIERKYQCKLNSQQDWKDLDIKIKNRIFGFLGRLGHGSPMSIINKFWQYD
jgi:SOS response regulatory protein OraA/RecX